MELITGKSNALLTHIRKLGTSASYRRSSGEFLCDNPKLLQEALLWGGEIHTVVCTEGTELPQLPEGVRTAAIPSALMRSVSPTETPQGVLTICGIPKQVLPEKPEGRRYVVLDGVQDPGNVGTVLRTADAFAADGIFLLPGCADLYNPKTVRSTMGAVFRCPVWSCSMEELAAVLKAGGLPLYGAALRDDTLDARDMDYSRCAIAIGSEGKGLSQQMLDLCDRTVKIPMQAHCESLNAAMAAAVLLWEAARGDERGESGCQH